jgi:hypothetical protein
VQPGAVPGGHHAKALFFHADDIVVFTVCCLVDLSALKQHICAFIFESTNFLFRILITCPNGIGGKYIVIICFCHNSCLLIACCV